MPQHADRKFILQRESKGNYVIVELTLVCKEGIMVNACYEYEGLELPRKVGVRYTRPNVMRPALEIVSAN